METMIFSIAFFLLFLGSSSFADKAPYYSFMREAVFAPRTMYYDYVIIGGGTSGCPLASTLSQAANVLVLERGGSPYENPNVTRIENFSSNLLDMSPSSPTQQFVSQDGVLNARAKVLGGGSALNAGFYTRAQRDYVKRTGWDEALVNQSYQWVERIVAFQPLVQEWQASVRDGLLEVGIFPNNGFTYAHVHGTKIGGTIFDQNGYRHTSADLLQYADSRRLGVYLRATVHKILFRHRIIKGRARPKAYGVVFQDTRGVKHIAYLNRNTKSEIILSAGAIGSPQILMLSGVGPAHHLRAHRIKVVVNQPLVGQGMADNPMNILFIPSPKPVEVSLVQTVGITRFGSYIEAASGLSFSFATAHRLLKDFGPLLNKTGQESPLFKMGPSAVGRATLRGGIILEKITGPLSTGHLELQTTNPSDNPRVTFNYFKEPEDLRRCVEGMKTIIKVINSKAFSKFRYRNIPVQSLIDLILSLPINLRPRHPSAAFSLEQFCIDTVMTIWHYHGGCQVKRVVDKDYKVYGVDSLRVIDGSTFYASPGTNPQATVMMLGRYMGQRILSERSSHHGKKKKKKNII